MKQVFEIDFEEMNIITAQFQNPCIKFNKVNSFTTIAITEFETCKWKATQSRFSVEPHYGARYQAVGSFKYCPICGKKIEVIQ